MPDSNDLGPHEVTAALLRDQPALTDDVKAIISPILSERDSLRSYLATEGLIAPISEETPIYDCGAADGAHTITPMVLGDHIVTLAVATTADQHGNINTTGHSSWAAMQPHSPNADLLAKATMMVQELSLLSTIPDEFVKIIDGSHVTALTTIMLALGSHERTLRNTVIEQCSERDFTNSVAHIANHHMVVACPKADSTTGIWQRFTTSRATQTPLPPLPDKPLAALILDPGEMLTVPESTPAWSPYHAARSIVSDPEATQVADTVHAAAEPLIGNALNVVHAKAPGATDVVRVEMHAATTGLDQANITHSIITTVHPPFIQEPLTQHLADLGAKQVSVVKDVQMETLRFALAQQGASNYLPYLLAYRT